MLLPSPLGATANSGRSSRPTATTSRCRRWPEPWADEGSCSPSATRRSDASSPGPAAPCFLSRRRAAAGQSDFSEFETTGGGIWRLFRVVDYVAKIALACPVTTTQTAAATIASLEAARAQAEAWLGRPLLSECLDAQTGELLPIAVVTDNGPAYKPAAFARYIAARPEFTHVRTRHRSPGTNGVIERFFQALKYEHLYREEIEDGVMVSRAIARYLTPYNAVRPHEAIGFRPPLTA